ncbi:DNA repair protein RecO [Betaproteobacteria bacterium]|nr:DNA repair protein RecO [Betaproteobacteria bacterium]GHU44536.1 DNA repair protein RecO [Betaproteobacteria bacterium]
MPRGRIDAQPAYVLHTRPYRETSLLVEAFSQDFGRIALLARGARRPHSALRGLIMAFQPLELSWSGKGEVFTLMRAEWQGGQPLLTGLPLFCGYYINELLMRLLPREDAHPRLFEHYARMLLRLGYSAKEQVAEADLRSFECALLAELGYGLTLDRDYQGKPIIADARYRYEIERGAVLLIDAADTAPFALTGQSLLDMAHDDYRHPTTKSEAKQLIRRLLAHYLDGVELNSRTLFGAWGR